MSEVIDIRKSSYFGFSQLDEKMSIFGAVMFASLSLFGMIVAKRAKIKNQAMVLQNKSSVYESQQIEMHDDDYGRYYGDEATKNKQILEKLFKIERNKMLRRSRSIKF